ncbi:lasso peptide biosynthesis B2 protein [Paenibacillus sp. CF095]|uniref:lasso peptide biosynthesis B2 protein n=1 Tax=Paenibacillus sp. CF095 TaxID=1881033 RepID=UPI000B819C2C|nr:lasso peptide biosynthesis B2 protein [Paenibacillus sp. CF095]
MLNSIRKRLLFIESLFMLCLSWILLRLVGIKIVKIPARPPLRKKSNIVGEIYDSVWNAAQYLPFSCKCIEIAFAVKIMSLLRRLDMKVVIGVRISPFMAHSWIESEDKYFGISDPNSYKAMGWF